MFEKSLRSDTEFKHAEIFWPRFLPSREAHLPLWDMRHGIHGDFIVVVHDFRRGANKFCILFPSNI